MLLFVFAILNFLRIACSIQLFRTVYSKMEKKGRTPPQELICSKCSLNIQMVTLFPNKVITTVYRMFLH